MHDMSYWREFSTRVIPLEQCIPRVTRAQHVSYLQNFSRHRLHMFFVNMDMSYTVYHNHCIPLLQQ